MGDIYLYTDALLQEKIFIQAMQRHDGRRNFLSTGSESG